MRKEGNVELQMVHVDEFLANWTGDPLALACKGHEVTIKAGTELPISRYFDLRHACDADDWATKPWPLRYGWAYRLGVRPVWVCGVSLTLKEAAEVYDAAADHTLPGGESAAGWRRFLRHDPILPPIVLLPAGAATQPTRLGRQSALKAILRTSRYADENRPDPDKNRSDPDKTWRLVLPPHISLEEAIRHGAFDARTSDEQFPAGAIPTIEYKTNDRDITFPVYGPDPSKPLQPRLFDLSAVTGDKNNLKNPGAQGEPVFRATPAATTAAAVLSNRRENQFYPDLLAENLVIALRPAGTNVGEAYFDGPRVTVPVRDPRQDFKDILPVAVAFDRRADRSEKERAKEPRQADFLLGQPFRQRIKSDATRTAAGPTEAGVDANVVTFALAPGEALEADCWFLPSELTLRRYFELPETLAIPDEAEADRRVE